MPLAPCDFFASGPQHSKDWFWLIITGFQWFYCWSQVSSSTLPTRQTQEQGHVSHASSTRERHVAPTCQAPYWFLKTSDNTQSMAEPSCLHFISLLFSLLFTITQIWSSMQCPQNIVRNWFGCSSNVFSGRAHRKDVRHHVGICHYQFCLPPKTNATVCCKLLLSRV